MVIVDWGYIIWVIIGVHPSPHWFCRAKKWWTFRVNPEIGCLFHCFHMFQPRNDGDLNWNIPSPCSIRESNHRPNSMDIGIPPTLRGGLAWRRMEYLHRDRIDRGNAVDCVAGGRICWEEEVLRKNGRTIFVEKCWLPDVAADFHVDRSKFESERS